MTLNELKQELKWMLTDPTAEEHMTRMIREERLSFAAEYELPALRMSQPHSGVVTTANWLYALPITYHKMVFRARNSEPDGGSLLPISREIASIDAIDPDHDETGAFVTHIAVQDREFAIYPKANDTIYLWFYEKPDTAAAITEIPDEWVHKCLVPRLVLRCFKDYPDLGRTEFGVDTKAFDYWRRRQAEGLYGSAATGEIGFINFLTKSRPPRVRGGRQPLP